MNTLPNILVSRPIITLEEKDFQLYRGRLVNDPTHKTTVLFLLRQKRGTSAALPNIGSEYHTLEGKLTPQNLRSIELMTLRALDPLITGRQIYNVTAKAMIDIVPGRCKLVVSWYDTRGNFSSVTEYLTLGRTRPI